MRTPLPDVAGPQIVEDLGHPLPQKKSRPIVIDVDEVLRDASDPAEAVVENRSRALLRQVVASVWRRRRAVADPGQTSLNPEVVTFLLRVVAERRPIYLCSQVHQEPFVAA